MANQDLNKTDLAKIVAKTYKPKKINSQIMAEYAAKLDFITPERAFLMDNKKHKVLPIECCGDWLKFATNETMDKVFLYDSRFCNWRFCAMCERRKSLHRGFALGCIMRRLVHEKKRFIFVTLTIPNVYGEDLRDALTHMSQSWDRMSRRAKYKKIIVGSVRKTEVTYNKEKDTYHPHLHVLICVDDDYFKPKWIKVSGKNKRSYPNMITHDELLTDWQKATRMEQITQVDIRAISNNANQIDKAILEVSKYTSKDSDMSVSESVFKWFYKGLKGKKLFTSSGILDEYFKLFKKDKTLFKDFYDERTAVKWEYLKTFNWRFKKKDYEQYVRNLTSEEREKINKKWLGASVELEENSDK